MLTHLIGSIPLTGFIQLVFFFCFLAVIGFECVNGFHDTANAVATVIYTKTLKPYPAIIWSGIWNFLGVLVIGTAVAMSLMKLVPINNLIKLPIQVGACLAISILLASIAWNLGTWYLGLPLSSTHTLVGALIGASLAFSLFYGGPGEDWSQAIQIGLSLLISPVVGFVGSALLLSVEKKFLQSSRFFHTPDNDEDKPPMPIRALLVTTCTLVSFFHGSNDGQKGVGLLMAILIIFLPATFAFNPAVSDQQTKTALTDVRQLLQRIPSPGEKQQAAIKRLDSLAASAEQQSGKKAAADVKQKFEFRQTIQQVTAALKKMTDDKATRPPADVNDPLKKDEKSLQKVTDFAPIWVLLVISCSLGIGTMIGWKRIVVTVGERIGNERLNYAEGATAEIIAAATIGLSSGLGLPVSTTHVLSSGVAGAMRASKGTGNLNYKTLKNIGMAWLLTLPAAIALSFLLFVLCHVLFLNK